MEVDQVWLVVLGAALVTAVLVDIVWTVLTVSGGRGPLSTAVARSVWSLGSIGRPGHTRLSVAGVLAAAAVPAVWLLLTWAGFSLAFLSDAEAVVGAASQEPTTALGRLAYAAGGLAGAGASLVAGTEAWELVNNLSAVVGLVLVTLSLTYLLQIVTAVSSERSMASQIAALGATPAEAVGAAASAPGLGTFPLQLVLIANGLSQAGQDHLAFPMLQFFHTPSASSSVPLNVARYDEILSVLEHAVPGEHTATVRTGRQAVADFIDTLRIGDHHPEPPPPPSLLALRRRRDDVAQDAEFAVRLEPAADRRARLRAYVEREAWSWDDVDPVVRAAG